MTRLILPPMPEPARFLKSLKLAAFLLILLLSACATQTVSTRGDNEQATRAEQLARNGNLEAAAQQFLELAGKSGGSASAYYRLRAGECLRDNGDIEAAARAIGDIRRKRLGGDEPLRLDLLEAEIALERKDPQRAAALLTIAEDSIPDNLRLRVLELRARTDEANGDRFAAARTRAMLDARLDGHDRDVNRTQIIETLSALDDKTLKDRAASLRPDDSLLPWIEQTLRLRGQILPREVPRPHQHHRRHRQAEDHPQPCRVFDPEEGPAVQQHVAHGAAAKCRQTGDHTDADGVQTLSRGRQQTRQRKGQGGQHLDDHQELGQRGRRCGIHGCDGAGFWGCW